MNYQWQRRDRNIKHLLARVTDFLRYTFTPAFSLVMLACGVGALAIMATLVYRYRPLLAVGIFCGYTGFLLVVMIASFRKWKRYKDHYNNVFRK